MLTKSFSGVLILTAAMCFMNSESARARDAYATLRAECARQVGAYYDPGRKAYVAYGAASSAQVQNFYNCLDSRTMTRSGSKKR